MTFRGKRYEAIIEIEKLLYVEKKRLDAYVIQLKYARLIKNQPQVKSLSVELNLQQNFINELEELEKDLTETLQKLALEMNDIDDKVFIGKFVEGKRNIDLMNELGVSKATIKRSISRIDELLDKSIYGQKAKTFLEQDVTTEEEDEIQVELEEE